MQPSSSSLLLIAVRSSSSFQPSGVFPPIIIHNMIPATASRLIVTNIPCRLPRIHSFTCSSLDAVSFHYSRRFWLSSAVFYTQLQHHRVHSPCHVCILIYNFHNANACIGTLFTYHFYLHSFERPIVIGWFCSHIKNALYSSYSLRLKSNCNNIVVVRF